MTFMEEECVIRLIEFNINVIFILKKKWEKFNVFECYLYKKIMHYSLLSIFTRQWYGLFTCCPPRLHL